MLFNSLPFLLFFPVVCAIVWSIKNLKARNIFLLLASYFFYMNWEPKYGLLLAFCSIITYGGALYFSKTQKKSIFVATIVTLVSTLFFFKYLDFAATTLTDIFKTLGIAINVPLPKFLLPVGISFYTFQAIGYLVDVYKKKIQAEKNFVDFTLFISFFPQLVAGPIERAGNLLGQMKVLHKFDSANVSIGARQMLWGYFLKLVVADRLALYSDSIFNMPAEHNSSSIVLAIIFFSIQIYCDFAGYSLIAIGCSRMMGFSLMKNFDSPYFSCSITEFWRRWHISLSKWLKDYVYIPLGGNRCSPLRHKVNILLTFVISGIWHGANWTYIIWGTLHGVFQVFEKITGLDKPRIHLPGRIIQRLVTFAVAAFAWIFFRANSLPDAILIVKKLVNIHEYGMPFIDNMSTMAFSAMAIFILFSKDFTDTFLPRKKEWILKSTPRRYALYLMICSWILIAGVFDNGQFIYFQF